MSRSIFTSEQLEQMKLMYEAGMTLTYIAGVMGCSNKTVAYHLQKMGVHKPRGPKAALKIRCPHCGQEFELDRNRIQV